MLKQLSTNKAVAYDGLSDILFERTRRAEVSGKLKNLWETLADEDVYPIHFDIRVIPLNKNELKDLRDNTYSRKPSDFQV